MSKLKQLRERVALLVALIAALVTRWFDKDEYDDDHWGGAACG